MHDTNRNVALDASVWSAAGNREDDMEHFQEAKAIWMLFVPKSGQAETVQGELLRAVEKLRDGAIRNGNTNWDQGFEILLAYLGGHLLDPAVFSPDAIGRTEAILARLRDHADTPLDEGSYNALERPGRGVPPAPRIPAPRGEPPAPPLTDRTPTCRRGLQSSRPATA